MAARITVGLAICIVAAILMIGDVASTGWGSAIGVIGLGVIASAGTSSARSS